MPGAAGEHYGQLVYSFEKVQRPAADGPLLVKSVALHANLAGSRSG